MNHSIIGITQYWHEGILLSGRYCTVNVKQKRKNAKNRNEHYSTIKKSDTSVNLAKASVIRDQIKLLFGDYWDRFYFVITLSNEKNNLISTNTVYTTEYKIFYSLHVDMCLLY